MTRFRQPTVTISEKLSEKASKEGINIKSVAEAAIKRAIEKREFLRKVNKLLKNSKLTNRDAIMLGRKINAALAKRYAIK